MYDRSVSPPGAIGGASSNGLGAPPPPPARPAAARMPSPAAPTAPPREQRAKQEAPSIGASPSAYLAKLATLARDLELLAKGSLERGALRLLRQRLKEWAEDLRSVGGNDALADAVGDQAERLGAALSGTGVDLAVDLQAIANVLASLAQGGPLPPRKSGRAAFWK